MLLVPAEGNTRHGFARSNVEQFPTNAFRLAWSLLLYSRVGFLVKGVWGACSAYGWVRLSLAVTVILFPLITHPYAAFNIIPSKNPNAPARSGLRSLGLLVAGDSV